MTTLPGKRWREFLTSREGTGDGWYPYTPLATITPGSLKNQVSDSS